MLPPSSIFVGTNPKFCYHIFCLVYVYQFLLPPSSGFAGTDKKNCYHVFVGENSTTLFRCQCFEFCYYQRSQLLHDFCAAIFVATGTGKATHRRLICCNQWRPSYDGGDHGPTVMQPATRMAGCHQSCVRRHGELQPRAQDATCTKPATATNNDDDGR